MSIRPYNLFSCNSSGLDFTDAYYLLGPVPSDPILRIIYCSTNIGVPVLAAARNRLSALQISLEEALNEGFLVNYSVPNEELCSQCNMLGGQCGFDSVLGQPICICGDRPCPLPPGPGPASPAPSEALFVAGAVLAGVGLGWLIFHCRQRGKKRVASQPAQILSKEIKTPSSKGLLSLPSNNFTRSIPSYPSPKSDLGRGSSYFGVQVFNCTELEEATNNFDPSRELGDGGFGTVYHGVLPDGRVVAVKRLYDNNFKRLEQFMNEVEILTRLRHQNLVKLYGCTSRRARVTTLADHLHGKRAKSGLLSWPVRLNIAVQTAEALAYLHKSDTIHRDVKTNNILLDNDFHVKVADFGLSRLFPNGATHVSTAPQGTPGYVDPEYYQCYKLTEKSDVYSFGVVLIELISSLQAVDTNRHRHDINLSNMAINKIQNRTLHELVDSSLGFETNSVVRRMVTLVAELAFRCLQQERDMRPSMQEVLEGLRGIQNEDLNAHIVDMSMDDDAELLKGIIDPTSPDSAWEIKIEGIRGLYDIELELIRFWQYKSLSLESKQAGHGNSSIQWEADKTTVEEKRLQQALTDEQKKRENREIRQRRRFQAAPMAAASGSEATTGQGGGLAAEAVAQVQKRVREDDAESRQQFGDVQRRQCFWREKDPEIWRCSHGIF
ncbi:hypothetical protein DH2020_037500 [Rehmannia glutinosa]|uniref:Protein kinase domain-containing protein n=1 Tax=Rehmannia glutinosa TaxID=99300 RepID=A0ABR0V2Q3_REHGL